MIILEQYEKDKLTHDIIQKDIKSYYFWYVKCCFPSLIFQILGFGLLWYMWDLSESFFKSKIVTICVLLYILALIFTFAILTYSLFNLLKKDLKLTIVSDTFTNYDLKYVLRYSSSSKRKMMCFSNGQKFVLDWHRPYYPNSMYHKSMDEKSIINSSYPGDTFYLVLKNKKVINVYNKKYFESE